MYKYLIFIAFMFSLSKSAFAGGSCPDNINNSPGNSGNTIDAIVFDQSGTPVDTIVCERTGNSANVDCELDTYGFPNNHYVMINIGNPPNDIDCFYDIDGNSIDPLPVEIVEFTVIHKDNYNFVSWETSTETNNSHFTVEYSYDGFQYDYVKTVPGAGNSFISKYYEVKHRPAVSGNAIIYYRLSQTDYDGDFVNIGVKAIQTHYSEPVVIFSSNGSVVYNDFTDKTIEALYVYDYTGRLIQSRSNPMNTSFQFELPTNAIYMFHTIYQDGTVNSVKVMH